MTTTHAPIYTPMTPQERAHNTLHHVLAAQWNKTPLMILDSPPGAGKTGVAVRVAGMSMVMMKQRCLIVTQTNAQALDVTERLCVQYPTRTIHIFIRRGMELPTSLRIHENLVVLHSDKDLPQEPAIVVGNAVKWSWTREDVEPFDLMIVDEAYQLADFRFWQIANLAHRVMLIGDPGQIEPVITSDTTRWASNETGPHHPCPTTLQHHFSNIPIVQMPVSRRLRSSTVEIVQPAFYSDLPFEAYDAQDERGLLVENLHNFNMNVREAIDRIQQGESMAGVMLPPLLTGEHDPELSAMIANTACELVGASIDDMGQTSLLRPEDIGIACAHRSQVQAVRERLGSTMEGVLVETADRFQGLERKVMLIHHPLSGRSDASAFHLNVGRLCVMLSRHRVACLVFWRSGIRELLRTTPPAGQRTLGQCEDREHSGRRTHLHVLNALITEQKCQ